jgi:hypothetical protein
MDLSDLGATSGGVWSRREALTLLTPGAIDYRVARRLWQQPFRAVYADGGFELSPEQWAIAVVKAQRPTPSEPGDVPHAVACLRTAARYWGLPLIDDLDPATGGFEYALHDVAVRSGGRRQQTRPRTPGRATTSPPRQSESRRVLIRRRLALTPDDIVQLPSGIWVTTELRTAMDCCVVLSHEAAVCLLDAGLREKRFSHDELREQVQARAGKPGVRSQERAVSAADGRAESAAETLTRLLLLPSLPGLVPQLKLRDEHDRVFARFDLGDPAAKFAVETDGRRGHEGKEMAAKDHARDRRTGAWGWKTERVTWFDIRCQQKQTVARVVAAHRERLGRAA